MDATRDASSVDNMEDKVYGNVRCVPVGAMKRQEAAEAANRRRFGRTPCAAIAPLVMVAWQRLRRQQGRECFFAFVCSLVTVVAGFLGALTIGNCRVREQ